MATEVNLRQHERLEVLGITKWQDRNGDEKSYWTKIGSAFWNKDGSLNIKLDYVPARLATQGIQIRPPKPKRQEGEQDEPRRQGSSDGRVF